MNDSYREKEKLPFVIKFKYSEYTDICNFQISYHVNKMTTSSNVDFLLQERNMSQTFYLFMIKPPKAVM